MKGSLFLVAGGLAAVVVAYLLALTGPPRDANIGAGLLFLAGIGMAGLGAICFAIAAVVELVKRRRGGGHR